MNCYSFDQNGSLVASPDSNHLTIVWAMHENEPYIHHAFVTINQFKQSLFDDPIAVVDFSSTLRMITNKKIIKDSLMERRRHLPCRYEGNSLRVDLNDYRIVETLALNVFTKGKINKELNAKEFPSSLKISVNNAEYSVDFNIDRKHTPYQLMAPHNERMIIENRIIQNINLKETTI